MRVVEEVNLNKRMSGTCSSKTPIEHQRRIVIGKVKKSAGDLELLRIGRTSVKRENNSCRRVDSTLTHSSVSTRVASHWAR